MDRRAALRAFTVAAVGGMAGCASLPSSGGEPLDAMPDGSWWQAKRNPSNTAFVGRELDVSDVTTVWNASIPDAWVKTPPLFDGDRIFVGTAEGSVFGFDATSGERSWRAETTGVQCAPALLQESVVVPVDDGHLQAFDVTSGDEQWSVRLGRSLPNDVTVANGRLYVASTDGTVYSVEKGRISWRQSVGRRTVGKPAVVDGTLYVAVERRRGPHQGRVVALDAATGEVTWERYSEKALQGSVTVGQDAVYVPGARLNAMDEDEDTPRGAVFVLDPATGNVRDRLAVDPHYAPCPVRALAVGPDAVYAISCARVYAFDANGNRRWSTSVTSGVTTDLVACDSGVLLGDSNGGVYLLDAATGQSATLHSAPGLAVTPSVLQNTVVTAGTRGVALLA